AALFGPVAPGVLSLKAWQKVVTMEPVRLITGHGFETALRGRGVGLLPSNAPTTALFEFWYEPGIVGAFAAAFALYASIRRAGRDAPVLVPGAMA
ncbi:peptide ABC transporter permease, partial [Methylobacterium sp. A54F]